MELVPLTGNAYQLAGGSNAGLIVQDGRAVLVDTGLDKDTAKKILRHVDALKVKLAAVVITHAHADHFGGAATIKARTGAPVYAPSLEAAIVENPILEPLYLFSGAMPPPELRHKFTLADACKVDALLAPGPLTIDGIALQIIPAPGHAPNQLMVAGGGACFLADAVFAPDVLAKHGIPFMVDVDAWLKTLGAVGELDGTYAAFVPGHGEAVGLIRPWAAANAGQLLEIRGWVLDGLTAGGDFAGVVRLCADRAGLKIANLTSYCLVQTAVLGCIGSLLASGEAAVTLEENAPHLRNPRVS